MSHAIDETPKDHSINLSIRELTTHYTDDYAKLQRYAYSLVQDNDVAEDIVQQAAANTIDALEKGRQIRNLCAWLHCCIRNLAMDHLRVTPAQPLHELEDMASLTGPQELCDVHDHVQAVEDAVHDLPEHFRTAFLLAEVRGLNYREIAKVMNRSNGSTALMLHRARKRVRELAGPISLPAFGPLAHLLPGYEGASWSKAIRTRLSGALHNCQQSLANIAARAADQLTAAAAPLVAAALIMTGLASPVVNPTDPSSPVTNAGQLPTPSGDNPDRDAIDQVAYERSSTPLDRAGQTVPTASGPDAEPPPSRHSSSPERFEKDPSDSQAEPSDIPSKTDPAGQTASMDDDSWQADPTPDPPKPPAETSQVEPPSGGQRSAGALGGLSDDSMVPDGSSEEISVIDTDENVAVASPPRDAMVAPSPSDPGTDDDAEPSTNPPTGVSADGTEVSSTETQGSS